MHYRPPDVSGGIFFPAAAYSLAEVVHLKRYGYWIFCYGAVLALTLAAANLSSRAITVFSEKAPPERQHTIVIDAGHGGVDGGATSCTGRLESSINLEIALRLEALLQLLGYDTRMIRREDISVYTQGETIAAKKASDLKQRVLMVRQTPNPVLLSIHQNNFPDGRYSGAQVFYAATEGSAPLAKTMQEAFRSNLNPGSRRQEKKSSGVYLLDRIQCPGVLIECGFLSNPREEALLRSADYQKKLCCVIAASLGEYLRAA